MGPPDSPKHRKCSCFSVSLLSHIQTVQIITHICPLLLPTCDHVSPSCLHPSSKLLYQSFLHTEKSLLQNINQMVALPIETLEKLPLACRIKFWFFLFQKADLPIAILFFIISSSQLPVICCTHITHSGSGSWHQTFPQPPSTLPIFLCWPPRCHWGVSYMTGHLAYRCWMFSL